MYTEGCSEDLVYFFLFSPFQIHYILYIGLVTILTYIVLIFALYITDECSFTYLFICCFFSIFIHMFFIYCMQSTFSISY